MRVVRWALLAFLGGVALPTILAAATLSGNSPESAPSGQAPRFVLVPTGAGSFAMSGVAEFGGPASAVTDLSLCVQQLPDGFYWVVVIHKSDGAATLLAPLSVFDTSELEPERRTGDNPKQRTSGYQVQVLQTQALIKIPAPFDATDVAQLVIEDVNGIAFLTGTPARP